MIKVLISTIAIGMFFAYSFVVGVQAAEAPRPRTTATPTPQRAKVTPTRVPTRIPTPTKIPTQDAINCQLTYGNDSCQNIDNLSVDVRVAHPKTGEYVDNVLVNDPRYSCGADVKFLVTTINYSPNTLKNVIVTVTLPPEVTFKNASMPFTRNGNVLTRNLGDLKPGQTINIDITGTLNKQCAACPVITVRATSGAEIDEDSAEFCTVQNILGDKTPSQTKGGQPIHPAPHATTSPKSGPELLGLLPLLPGMAAGWYLRRRTAK